MTMERKTRTLHTKGGYSRGEVERWNSSTQKWVSLLKASQAQPSIMGSQVTDSESHSWPPPKGNRSDVGGSFFTSKRQAHKPCTMHSFSVLDPTYTSGPYTKKRINANFDVSCPIELNAQNKPLWPTAQNSNTSSLNALGATAISRCAPTSSAVELSTSLGELFREGLPRAIGAHSWEAKTLKAREASGEFLNYEFGWLPVVSDIEGLAHSIKNSDDILKQYDADRGKVIRRQYRFPDEESSSFQILGAKFPDGICIDSGMPEPSLQGVWSKATLTQKRRWFSGAFVYGAPLGINSRSNIADLAAKADKLFGLSLTPDVVWNLTPWSWATDWIFNTGDVLSNLSDFISQGLVMQYGYLMEETIVKVIYSLRGATYHGHALDVQDATLTVRTKSRTRANPYGFGVTWDGLTATQGAILAALGITRS